MSWSRIKKIIPGAWPLAFLGLVVGLFFWQFFFKGFLPIPADTIVGMYHPWRDIVWDGLTAGVPFKNFLITDPVRQQYPWRQLAISLFQKGQWPLWNPYSFAGTPLLANLQGAVFYPLNLLYFLNFNLVWAIQITLQPLLAGLFLYFYLQQMGLKKEASLLGALSFCFSGFFIAWLEWGTVLHSALWLPLVLLAIEKILVSVKGKRIFQWGLVLMAGLSFSFLAGHLQTSFYLILFSLVYLVWRLFSVKKNRPKLMSLFIICYLFFIVFTAIQWWPTLQFIKLSARGVDQANWQQPGWFLPWQHLVQFLAPDFFGNPTTLNYWGEWNYAEFVGYLGVIPLFLAFYAVLVHREKKTWFFALLAVAVLSFALPTPWAKLPYQLGLPLIVTSQPTRLLFLVDFCLAVLAALGLEHLFSRLHVLIHKNKERKEIFFVWLLFGFFYGALWVFVLTAPRFWPEAPWVVNLAVSKRNLILPSGVVVALGGLILVFFLLPKLFKPFKSYILKLTFFLILALTAFDLLRFGWKFTPLVKEEWLFPSTKTIEFLQKDKELFRLMTTDRRLMPPNFNLAYGLQTVSGYDPLYLERYAELIAASERGKPDISPPFGFNRIITPHNYHSPIIDLLNVKYVLSLEDETSDKLVKVFQEGETRVYENKAVLPRALMVYDYRVVDNKQKAIELLMNEEVDLAKTVVLEEELPVENLETGENQVTIKNYQENQVVVEVKTSQPGILVLSDAYYPDWKALIDGKESRFYRANYHFRGILVPKGDHQVVFSYGWY